MNLSFHKSAHPIKLSLLVLLVRFDLFSRTLFLGRRQKARFMGRMLLQQSRARRW